MNSMRDLLLRHMQPHVAPVAIYMDEASYTTLVRECACSGELDNGRFLAVPIWRCRPADGLGGRHLHVCGE